MRIEGTLEVRLSGTGDPDAGGPNSYVLGARRIRSRNAASDGGAYGYCSRYFSGYALPYRPAETLYSTVFSESCVYVVHQLLGRSHHTSKPNFTGPDHDTG